MPGAEVTVIGNTGDDITLFGLHVSPDLDTVMYTLGGGIDEGQGWGRAGDSRTVLSELAAYGAGPRWFGLGDLDIATHLHRTSMLAAGLPLSAVTTVLCQRWQPGVRLLPMSDDRVETHVVLAGDEGERTVHFQEWWVRMGAQVPAAGFVFAGAAEASPAPGVLEAIAEADVILMPPSNPVVSIGTILAVPGIAEAMRARTVVGVSPIIGGDRCAAWPTNAYGAGRWTPPRSGCGALRARCSTAGWSTRRTRPQPTHRNWPTHRPRGPAVHEQPGGDRCHRPGRPRPSRRTTKMNDPTSHFHRPQAAATLTARTTAGPRHRTTKMNSPTSHFDRPQTAGITRPRGRRRHGGRDGFPVEGLREITAGTDLAELIADAAAAWLTGTSWWSPPRSSARRGQGGPDRPGAGHRRRIGPRGRPPRAARIVETRHGLVLAAAGVDASNTPPGTVVLLPEDPDGSARRLRKALMDRLGVRIGVVVTDTLGRPWRAGQTDAAIGAAGVAPLRDYRGTADTSAWPWKSRSPRWPTSWPARPTWSRGRRPGIPVAVVRGLADLVTEATARRPGAGPACGRGHVPVRLRRRARGPPHRP